ncbi:MAG: DUF1934 domain-containing protein [Butyrivibrio sp.]|nr:DUF1934 domain-containing protein [Acetatifactor muris]MCM1560684.1 DUF1934 domain-containing protein [Butyrivibrio sp.]
MNRDVEITVAGTQDGGSGKETVTRYRTTGQYFEKNGCRYLLYQEQADQSETPAANTLKIKGNRLELSRKGGVHCRMVFEPGQTHPTDYVTVYGALRLEVCTEDLKCLWTETEARIRITYRLLTAGGLLSENKLVIKIRNISSEA